MAFQPAENQEGLSYHSPTEVTNKDLKNKNFMYLIILKRCKR